MPRARNIKYSFFENDTLAEIDPIGRLLFIGLWTLADYKGDIEYRAKKIKAQLLPYDDCDLVSIITNLDLSGFITIYNVEGISYIHIDKFTKHQNPHPNEKRKGSEIPAYNENSSQVIDLKGVAINHDLIVTKKDESITDRADPLSLIPDIPIPKVKVKRFAPPTEQEIHEYLVEKGHWQDGGAEARKFIDNYEAQGWKLSNGNKMVKWKSSVNNWLRNKIKWENNK